MKPLEGIGRILAATGLLVALTAAPVRAGAPVWSFGVTCGGTNFQTCASGSLSYYTDGAGNTVVLISVTNQGNDPSVFKAVGLINMPAGSSAEFTGGSAFGAGWTGEPPAELSGGGFPEGTYAAVKKVKAPTTGLMVGETLTFAFTFAGALSEPEVMALGIGVHGISGPYGCSTKLGILPDGEGGAAPVLEGPYNEECAGPVSTVPEPITMALLGTGLVGIAGVAHRRRRRDDIEADEAA